MKDKLAVVIEEVINRLLFTEKSSICREYANIIATKLKKAAYIRLDDLELDKKELQNILLDNLYAKDGDVRGYSDSIDEICLNQKKIIKVKK